MGRPIKKTFFGNLNREYYGSVVQGSGVGGEGVASISVSNTGSTYSQGATVSFTAPQITGGIAATGHPVFTTYGGPTQGVASIFIDDSGSGYVTAPTVTVVPAATVAVTATATNSSNILTNITSTAGIYVGMRADAPWGMQSQNYVSVVGTNSVTLTKTMNASSASVVVTFSDQGTGFADSVTLTSSQADGIAFSSYIPTGSSVISTGDIIKQEASRRYLVNNSQGQGQCILVTTSTLTAGQMNIVATDWNGSTYYVKKLTARRAVLVTSTATAGGFLIGNGVSTGWTLGAATGTTVTIANTI